MSTVASTKNWMCHRFDEGQRIHCCPKEHDWQPTTEQCLKHETIVAFEDQFNDPDDPKRDTPTRIWLPLDMQCTDFISQGHRICTMQSPLARRKK